MLSSTPSPSQEVDGLRERSVKKTKHGDGDTVMETIEYVPGTPLHDLVSGRANTLNTKQPWGTNEGKDGSQGEPKQPVKISYKEMLARINSIPETTDPSSISYPDSDDDVYVAEENVPSTEIDAVSYYKGLG